MRAMVALIRRELLEQLVAAMECRKKMAVTVKLGDAANRAVMAVGFVIAVPTTTNAAPSSMACRASSRVQILPSAKTGTEQSWASRSSRRKSGPSLCGLSGV